MTTKFSRFFDEIVEFFRIQDPDGWSNLRKTPGGQVLRKVYSDEKFELYKFNQVVI